MGEPASNTGWEKIAETPPKKKIKSDNELKPQDDEKMKEKLVEFKNGRLVFLEKKIEFDMLPSVMAELVKFNEFRKLEKEYNKRQLDAVPPEYLSLVGMLVQERDLTLSQLVKHVMHRMCPVDFDDDSNNGNDLMIAPKAVEAAIKAVATRKTYGVSDDSVRSLGLALTGVPPHVVFQRWEVKDISAVFAEDLVDRVQKRRIRREQASILAQELFDKLSKDEKIELLTTGSKRKSRITVNTEATPFPMSSTELNLQKTVLEEIEFNKVGKIGEVEGAENVVEMDKNDEEKPAKGAKLHMKQEAKELAKKKKEQGQTRLMGFFTPVKKDGLTQSHDEPHVDPKLAAFHELFQPFHVKQNVTIAESNRFVRPIGSTFDTQVCSGEGISVDNVPIVGEESRSLISDFFEKIHPRNLRKRGVNRHVDLRRLLGISTISVSNRDPHQPLDYSNDGGQLEHKVKMKLLQFHENHRPGYYGTCTKQSRRISGRRPFAADVSVFDYDYDSEAEWEEEGEGEDLKSEDEDEDERISQIDDEEEDGWLVHEGNLSEDERTENEQQNEKPPKQSSRPIGPLKRLIPVIVGPHLEDPVRDSTMEENNLLVFQIEILVEKSLPIDPFKEISPNDLTLSFIDTTPTKEAEKPKRSLADEHLPVLVNVIRENKSLALPKLVEAARLRISNVPKSQIEAKIKQVATKEKRVGDKKPCWYVLPDLPSLEKSGLSSSSIFTMSSDP